MSRTIVITSGKGGVGKTTATANLGMALAQLGYQVALIDADIGLRNLDLLLGLENRVIYTALEVLSGECRLEQALIKDKRQPGLALLPAAQNRNKDSINSDQMQYLVTLMNQQYDYILIDCPAGIESGFHNAIAPADEAIVVTTPEIAAVRDADRVIGLLEANNIYNVKLLINRVRPDMIQKNDGGILIIDYGYLDLKMHETLQAIKNHKYSNILEDIGDSDITYNINFSLFKKFTEQFDELDSIISNHKKFLTSMGIVQRAEIISENIPFSKKSDLFYRIRRLIDEKQMGELFKVMLIKKKTNKFKTGFEID